MIERIILIGDSFTFGHGCSDKVFYYDEDKKEFVGNGMSEEFQQAPSKYCWGSLIQKQFPNIEVVNIAKPGHCHMNMFRDFITLVYETKLNSNDLVMLNTTFVDRVEVASHLDPEVHVSWQTIHSQSTDPADYALAKKMYAKYLYNDTIGCNQSLAAIMGIYGIANSYSANFVWSKPVWPNLFNNQMKFILSEIDNKFYQHIFNYDFSRTRDEDFNQQCYMPDRHCNDKGHQLYYDTCILPLLQSLGVS
jgi:hypothetical protein